MTAVTYAVWQQWRTCGRKVRYATQIEANTAVLHVWKNGSWLRSYECIYCHGWHTTSHDRPHGNSATYSRRPIER